ncbi:hypothetical protein [Actinomadura bangladeshensis]|uniref:Uncharacterized protein n=1 Tax=Actinomadura bangladeshensis TaxID=453573 RepID=A0A4R4N1Q3_9ACTN|nr:hypothetical protein [Actinomadura bangladeshensis]TDC00993.1 hypothetical protein E1284_40425 [Actinomadura bangladeshensis]
MDEIERVKARLREEFPGWSIIRTDRGRWWATRGPLTRENLNREASADADTPNNSPNASGRCSVPAEIAARRHLLRWRTRLGRATATRNLDLLAVAVQAKGYRHIKLYQAGELPTRPPVLWVFAFGPDDHVRAAVTVCATSGRELGLLRGRTRMARPPRPVRRHRGWRPARNGHARPATPLP